MDEASRSGSKRCAGSRKDGSRCTAPVMGSGAFCFAHNPQLAAEREAARKKGGANSAARARLERLVPATLRPMIGALIAAMGEVHEGTLDPKRATAMAALAGAVVRAYGVGVLDERVAALESHPDASAG